MRERRQSLRITGSASSGGFFAHKTSRRMGSPAVWHDRGGWTITGSWPIATEMATRLRARDSASLRHERPPVCRPRPEDAAIGDWGQVLRELPKRVADWMSRLQEEGVRGADLVFACIGPALEVFSRYSKVVDAEEREIPSAAILKPGNHISGASWRMCGKSLVGRRWSRYSVRRNRKPETGPPGRSKRTPG